MHTNLDELDWDTQLKIEMLLKIMEEMLEPVLGSDAKSMAIYQADTIKQLLSSILVNMLFDKEKVTTMTVRCSIPPEAKMKDLLPNNLEAEPCPSDPNRRRVSCVNHNSRTNAHDVFKIFCHLPMCLRDGITKTHVLKMWCI